MCPTLDYDKSFFLNRVFSQTNLNDSIRKCGRVFAQTMSGLDSERVLRLTQFMYVYGFRVAIPETIFLNEHSTTPSNTMAIDLP